MGQIDAARVGEEHIVSILNSWLHVVARNDDFHMTLDGSRLLLGEPPVHRIRCVFNLSSCVQHFLGNELCKVLEARTAENCRLFDVFMVDDTPVGAIVTCLEQSPVRGKPNVPIAVVGVRMEVGHGIVIVIQVHLDGHTDILEIRPANLYACLLLDSLKRRHEYPHENSDDRNDHKKLDQGKGLSFAHQKFLPIVSYW